jgi:hypothetical protein
VREDTAVRHYAEDFYTKTITVTLLLSQSINTNGCRCFIVRLIAIGTRIPRRGRPPCPPGTFRLSRGQCKFRVRPLSRFRDRQRYPQKLGFHAYNTVSSKALLCASNARRSSISKRQPSASTIKMCVSLSQTQLSESDWTTKSLQPRSVSTCQ